MRIGLIWQIAIGLVNQNKFIFGGAFNATKLADVVWWVI